MQHALSRIAPFPFESGRFPDDLGAVVQRTVLAGTEPARVVVHDSDGFWLIGDGINDPDQPGACVLARIAHVAESDPAVASLATLPAGRIAERDGRDVGWRIAPHAYPNED